QAALMAQIYNEALQAFQRGEWGPAASGFAKLIAMVPNEAQAQIAPAYLTMGAAYYNMPNFPKAIEVFSGFIKQFPNSERLLDAKMALGQTYMAAKNYDEAIKLYATLEATPAVREQALTFQALAYKFLNKKDDAI